MTADDRPVIADLLRRTSEFNAMDVTVAEELIDTYLMNPVESGYHIQVIEADGKTAGYVCYGEAPLTEGSWDVYWIAVAPEEQGKGLGKALLKAAEDSARAARGRLLFIETSSKPEYERTRQFYYSQHYQFICQITDYYTTGDDKVIFQKRLLNNF